MRYLVLSDVHANIDALDAVLADAGRIGYDRGPLLGDMVGYGAAPNAVLDRVRALDPLAAIRGNHDKVAAGLGDTDNFNPLAKQAAQWTRHAIDPDNIAYLEQLPMGPIQVDDLVEICHGTPFDEDVYVADSLDAIRGITEASRALCLFGHTHIPLVVALEDGDMSYDDVEAGQVLKLTERGRYMINVGSVGQPRDGDPRAAYALVDTEAREVQFFRTPYPVEAAQDRIRKAGLPEQLALRLAAGR